MEYNHIITYPSEPILIYVYFYIVKCLLPHSLKMNFRDLLPQPLTVLSSHLEYINMIFLEVKWDTKEGPSKFIIQDSLKIGSQLIFPSILNFAHTLYIFELKTIKSFRILYVPETVQMFYNFEPLLRPSHSDLEYSWSSFLSVQI